MLLVIDVGNTNMEFGVYRGEELVGSFRLMTDASKTPPTSWGSGCASTSSASAWSWGRWRMW